MTLAPVNATTPFGLPTWGKILNDAQGQSALYHGYYYWVVAPAFLLMLTGLGFAMRLLDEGHQVLVAHDEIDVDVAENQNAFVFHGAIVRPGDARRAARSLPVPARGNSPSDRSRGAADPGRAPMISS